MDDLREARLEQPHVARLCGCLGYEGSFLTVEDMAEAAEDMAEDMAEAAEDMAEAHAAKSTAHTADAQTRKAGRQEGRE